jgi:hypothetical protein
MGLHAQERVRRRDGNHGLLRGAEEARLAVEQLEPIQTAMSVRVGTASWP